MNDAADTRRVGNVVITRVVDVEIADFPTQLIFPEMTNAQVSAVEWLQPHYVTPEGNIRISYHSYVIETQGVRIIVDTCVGDAKPRFAPYFNQLSTGFIQRLTAAGFKPDDIDYVLCTHLHFDHIGWNTCWNGKDWVPTFPKARYLFARTEWDHWQHEIERTPASDENYVGLSKSRWRRSLKRVYTTSLKRIIILRMKFSYTQRPATLPGM